MIKMNIAGVEYSVDVRVVLVHFPTAFGVRGKQVTLTAGHQTATGTDLDEELEALAKKLWIAQGEPPLPDYPHRIGRPKREPMDISTLINTYGIGACRAVEILFPGHLAETVLKRQMIPTKAKNIHEFWEELELVTPPELWGQIGYAGHYLWHTVGDALFVFHKEPRRIEHIL